MDLDMRKMNGKLIVSALLAAALMSVTAVTAGAVDYSDEGAPTTVEPEQPAVLTDSDIANALAAAELNGSDEVVIPMEEDSRGNVSVQEAAIAEIAGSDVAVTVEITSESGNDYSITIDPSSITEVKAVNLAMQITVDTDEGMTVSGGYEVPAGSIVIAPAQKGDFGMTLQVNIPAVDVEYMDKSVLSLYYIADDGSVTKMPDSALRVNSDGSITVSISHASQYVVSDTDLTETLGTDTADPDDGEVELEADDDIIYDDDIEDDSGALISDSDVAGDADTASGSGRSDADVALVSTVNDDLDDDNPGTGAALALGALAVSAAAVVITAKKRK